MKSALIRQLSFAAMLFAAGIEAVPGAPSSGLRRRSDEPKLYEVSAPTGDVAYFQVTPDARTALFRDPAGRLLAIENDQKHFPGYIIRFAQGSQELQVFSSLIFYEEKQPLPVIYVINGKYIAGIDDGGGGERDLTERAKKEFRKVPEDFRDLLLAFYRFAEKGVAEMGAPSSAVETLLSAGPGSLKPFDTHTRLIEDVAEAAKIKSMMTP